MADFPETLAPAHQGEAWALEAERNPHRRITLGEVKRILEQDPKCPDALRLNILLDACPPKEKLPRLKALAEQLEAEGAIGLPVIRALMAFARTLEVCGKTKDAVPIYEKALQVDPGDPLEVHHHLARCLLDLRQLKGLKALRERYPEKANALTAWTCLLEIQKSEKQTGLDQALQEARRANHHVEDFLTSRCRVPKHHDVREKGLPGSLEEALHVLDMIGEAWFSDRTALSWIIKQK